MPRPPRPCRPARRLGRRTLSGPVLDVAVGLLGSRLVRQDGQGRVVARVTEVEAYHGTADPGSHAFRGRTPRTEVMFGPAGHLYVYFTYGMHWCANVVTGPDGEAAAVLLRAAEVVDGVPLARSRRPACRRDADLARGPARLARALGLDGRWNGVDLCSADAALWLEVGQDAPAERVRRGPRVGVSGDGGDGARFPWRFWLDGEASVSGYRAGRPRPGPAAGGGTLSRGARSGPPGGVGTGETGTGTTGTGETGTGTTGTGTMGGDQPR